MGNIEDLYSIVKRSLEQMPEGLSYVFDEQLVHIKDICGMVTCSIRLRIPVDEQVLFVPVRFTATYLYQNQRWTLFQFHGSFPSSEQAEGESWPVNALKARNKELEKLIGERTAALEESLKNLKATQNQLIHAEKMASLGELTAGIAHEIQNPLNFINNFSDLNNELLNEMQDAVAKNDKEEAAAVMKDIQANLEKIHHHGKRADAIVKNMLQHSRKTSAQKEPVDINALADEYLRLSYHGLRAKDSSFNASIQTSFDESVGMVDAIPQDLGRVLLNLFNNAFYAVNERKREAGEGFEATVTIKTGRRDDQIEISIRDNGKGIPASVKEKIFQPFFTTKPTGEGTGLGLSLSYDIITKGHGGQLNVESVEGEGTAFIICLPDAAPSGNASKND